VRWSNPILNTSFCLFIIFLVAAHELSNVGLRLVEKYRRERLQLVGWVEMLSADKTEYHWSAPQGAFAPRSKHWLTILKDKTASPIQRRKAQHGQQERPRNHADTMSRSKELPPPRKLPKALRESLSAFNGS